jgi:hypothetical protein
MRIITFFFLCFIGISSCNSDDKKASEVKTMNPKDIRPNEIVHDSLSPDQVAKITRIQATFADVFPVSLDETITNFKRDLNPDNEIAIWLKMTDAYEKYITSRQTQLDLNKKKEVFKLILSRSMMAEDEAIENAKLELLTEKDAKEVLSFYSETPIPIKVGEK